MISKDNIMFKYMVKVLDKTIGVVSNVKGTEKMALGTKQWLGEKIDYNITLMKSDTMNSSYIKDSSFLTIVDMIDEIIDEEICFNNKYIWLDGEIKEYTFPGSCIVISESDNKKNTIISSQMDILMFYFKRVLKEIIGDIYCKNGYEKIHASGVEKNNRAYLFIGNGFAGKSTTVFKLLEKGCNMINDDMLFLKISDNKLYVVGAPICCSLRDDAHNYVNIKLKKENMYSSKYQETSYYSGMPYNGNEIFVDTVIFLGNYEMPQRIMSYEELVDFTEISIIKRYIKEDSSKLNIWKANRENASNIVN